MAVGSPAVALDLKFEFSGDDRSTASGRDLLGGRPTSGSFTVFVDDCVHANDEAF